MSTWKGKHGPLLIAEIGGNHEGDLVYAKRLTELAIEADVDYIKYQIYTGDTLVNPLENPIRNKHFKKFELGKDAYRQLAGMCHEADIKFMASVWEPSFCDWVDDFSDVYKIGSGDFTAYPVLEKFCDIGKPLIISTGLCNQEEVKGTVDFIQKTNAKYKSPDHLAILQCTSMYPIPASEAHLSVMQTYKDLFKLPVGYSDHTEGSYALEIAVALGAEILEFHFTDTREGKSFRDHKVSLTASEVHDLQKKIKLIKALKGSSTKSRLAVEGEHPITFRRACYPSRDIKAGEQILSSDLVYLRPNHGIDARDYQKLIGKKAVRNLHKFEKLALSDFTE